MKWEVLVHRSCDIQLSKEDNGLQQRIGKVKFEGGEWGLSKKGAVCLERRKTHTQRGGRERAVSFKVFWCKQGVFQLHCLVTDFQVGHQEVSEQDLKVLKRNFWARDFSCHHHILQRFGNDK